jgi:hypothetical protein
MSLNVLLNAAGSVESSSTTFTGAHAVTHSLNNILQFTCTHIMAPLTKKINWNDVATYCILAVISEKGISEVFG